MAFLIRHTFTLFSICQARLAVFEVNTSEIDGSYDVFKYGSEKSWVLAEDNGVFKSIKISSDMLHELAQKTYESAGDGWYENYHNESEIID